MQILCDLAVQNSNSKYLITAAHLLTSLHQASPSNFKAMLMTAKIYHWLGFIPNASMIYTTIEPKYIQLDSLGYLYTGLFAPFSWSPAMAKQWYCIATRFFQQSAKESVDYLAMSYKNGTFSKLQELLDFRDRLMNSRQNHQIVVETAILELILMSGPPNSSNFVGIQQLRNLNINPEHAIDVAALVDNRDLEVIIRWDPVVENDFDDETVRERKRIEGLDYAREQSFKEQVLLLRIRKALLNLVVAQVNGLTGQLHHGKQYIEGGSGCTSSETKESPSDFVDVLTSLRAQWSELFKSVPQVLHTHYPESYLVNQLLSQLHVVTQVPYESFMDSLSSFSLCLIVGDEENGANVARLGDLLVAHITGLAELVGDVIKQQDGAADQFWTYRSTVEKIASVVELLSLTTLIVAVLDKRTATKGNSSGAKKSAASASTSEWSRGKQAAVANVTKCLKQQLVAVEMLLGNSTPRDLCLSGCVQLSTTPVCSRFAPLHRVLVACVQCSGPGTDVAHGEYGAGRAYGD